MTAIGIDNYGRMSYRYGYEEIDYVDGTQDWVWNAPQHVLFLRIRQLFDAELCTLYTQLESLGAWSATGLINQFNEWQEQFPEELWRLDIDRKYIRTYTSSFINGPARPEFLKERANGRKKTQRSQFERNQEKYMSSKFGGNVAAADDIIMRCSVPNETLAVTPNFDMHLTPYSYIYLNVKYNTSPPIRIRAIPNTEYTIKYDSELADIIEIYSASCLTSIGDLSACYLTNGDFSNASKIKELKLGNDTPGYKNSNEMTLGLGSNELLTKLDIQNMSGLTSSVDVSTLKNLKEVYAFGSNISGAIFADGGNVSTVELPEIGSLQMKNLAYLENSGFEVTSYNNLTRLVVENSKLDLITLINSAPNLYQVRLVGLDWTLNDSSILERLYSLAGVTSTGANADRAILTGSVHVPVMREQLLSDYHKAWPDLDITYDTLINQFAATFVNDDGTILDIQYVDKGSKPVDPVTRADNPIDTPTKVSTVSTDFTFAGWDTNFIGMFENMTFTATYSETLRKYTVKYASKGVVLQESVNDYGTTVFYHGDIPKYTAEESAYKYHLFSGWDKSGFVNGDKVVNAVYDVCEYTLGYFDGKDLNSLRPVELYAMTQLGLESESVDLKDYISFEMGNDYTFEDIEEKVLISERTDFTGNNHIDTNVSIFTEDRDFVLAIDYKFSEGNVTNNTLAQCYQTNGSNGFRLWYSNEPKLAWGTSSLTPSSVNKREMMIIRHIKGENKLHVYISNLDGDEILYSTLEKTKSTITDATLVFGCAKPEAGAYENHALGTVYWSKIWYADLGDEACRNLAIYPHQKMKFEMGGFKRYYLSDNSSKRCSMTFLATTLLDRNMILNNSQTNTGGWAECSLNTKLNTRIINAIPLQYKQLIKQVQVPSSVGNKSMDISTSDCYIFIPSAIEVEPSMTNEPYIYEGTSIPYLTTNESRICAYEDGTPGIYLLRSPNAAYNSYYYRVDESGGLYGYYYAYTEGGVRIIFNI